VGEAMIAIAQLAGYLRRAGEGPPGFECWWKGYAILRSMVKIMQRHHASKSKPRRPMPRSKSVAVMRPSLLPPVTCISFLIQWAAVWL